MVIVPKTIALIHMDVSVCEAYTEVCMFALLYSTHILEAVKKLLCSPGVEMAQTGPASVCVRAATLPYLTTSLVPRLHPLFWSEYK